MPYNTLIITQNNLNLKIFNFHIHNLHQNTIYQAPTHQWKQSGISEPAVFKHHEEVHFVNILCFIFSRANSRLPGPLIECGSMPHYFCYHGQSS